MVQWTIVELSGTVVGPYIEIEESSILYDDVLFTNLY